MTSVSPNCFVIQVTLNRDQILLGIKPFDTYYWMGIPPDDRFSDTGAKSPGNSGSTGASRSTIKTTKNSTTAPGPKAPVPKPYALTELRHCRSDQQGDPSVSIKSAQSVRPAGN
ncbi:MAG: hypothetical protein ACSLFB_10120 [Acidimicrobiales bacterium]